MFNFFRKIRKQLLGEGKTARYFKYALGEILLVMIGILLALQVNNWNQNRQEKKLITNYYQRIHEELITTIKVLSRYGESIDGVIKANKRSLTILNMKNRDSLGQLEVTIGALATAYAFDASMPLTEEFINEGNLSKIENEDIKTQFQFLGNNLTRSKSFDDYMENQYALSIEPYFYDKINYANVAIGFHKRGLVLGGPQTDYQQFYDDMELWNLLTFKLETLNSHIRLINRFEYNVKTLDSLILKELNNK